MYWMTHKKPGYWEAAEPHTILHFCSYPKPWDQAPKGPLERVWWVQFAMTQLTLKMRGLNLTTPPAQEHKGSQEPETLALHSDP